MRRLLVGLVAVCMLMLSGTAHAEKFVRIASGTVGGGFYNAGTALVSVLNAVQKDINYSAVTGGSIKNLISTNKRDVEFGMSLTSTLYEGWNGVQNFPQPLKDLRFVAAIYPQVAHILVGPGINSIGELRGKRVDFGPIGGGIDTNNRLALEAYGIPESEVKIQRNSRTETAEAFQTGGTDAQILLTSYPSAQVNDMLQHGARLIPVEKEKRDELVKKYPFYINWDIPKGTYDGYNEDLTGYSAFCVLLAHKDMDAEIVYKTVKLFFENEKLIKERRPAQFDFFSLKNAMAGCDIPLHAGAERYYKEMGLIK